MTDEPLDQKETSGDLRTVVEGLREKVVANNTSRLARGEGFEEQELSTYPEWALRELLQRRDAPGLPVEQPHSVLLV